MVKASVAIVVALLCAAAWFFWEGKTARDRVKMEELCLAAVDGFRQRFEADPPESSLNMIHNTVAAGTRMCKEHKFKEALRVLDTDQMTCYLNNGCGYKKIRGSVQESPE